MAIINESVPVFGRESALATFEIVATFLDELTTGVCAATVVGVPTSAVTSATAVAD